MSLTTPTYSAASPVNSGDAVINTNENLQLDPQKTFIEAIDGLTRVSTSTTPYTITANQEVVLYVNATSGNKIVNLPAETDQYSSITIKKIDATYNTVTVNTTGSYTIESKTTYALAPATTSYVLSQPDESVKFSLNGTQYRVEAGYTNNRTAFSAYLTSNVAMSITTAKVSMSAEEFDLGGNYQAASSRYVIPVVGIYEFGGMFRMNNLNASTRMYMYLYKNGSAFKFAGSCVTPSTSLTGDPIWPMSTVQASLVPGDFIEVFYELQAGTGTLVGGAGSTYWSGKLISNA